MPRDRQALSANVASAIRPQFRSRLLARGQAQSMIRREGILPDGAPAFDSFLDEDLLGYGYSLISTSLRLISSARESESDTEPTTEDIALAREGLIQASYAIEAATRNALTDGEIAFHRLVAGAASHLAGYAARAYSLVRASRLSERLTPMEHTLADLITRSLDEIESRARRLRSSVQMTDDALLSALVNPREIGDTTDRPDESADDVGPIALILSENYMSAAASALFAIAHRQQDLLATALDDLQTGEQASLDASFPGPWWVYRLTRQLLDDLFQTSISVNLPDQPPPTGSATPEVKDDDSERRWQYLRSSFVASLFARGRSEIDLWPSQLHVVHRIFEENADLVVSLPTSAGKTRIAELCVLSCLAQDRRVVYVTPLRALSAQTELVLERTFVPLGARVSSLYGSMGVSDFDENTLRTSHIVVATPEKLDFALRSDPTILDDVGLVVLDEGHMIGPSEREVRYEAQIQRLLRRPDSETRRIVCLSAVFPSGEDLDDFVSWITNESADGLHREHWRPTQQRFGLIEWRGDHARLSITLGEEQPFIPRFLEPTEPGGRRRRLFPADQRELVIASGWRLVEEGQTVLIFCPQRISVGPYAREIVRLRRQGLIDSLLPPGVDLSSILAIGAEWFGADHPILECLRLGVAIHHGALPAPFRREVERLLHAGSMRVTVASPTLAQGLNLSASVVLFHGLRRSGNLLTGSEFSNVIGRAGRAFVDTEGLVLYPVFEPEEWKRREWIELSSGDSGKTLRSGLIEAGVALIQRIAASIGRNGMDHFLAYLTGDTAWSLPVVANEAEDANGDAAQSWESNLSLLDLGILSILGDDDSDPDVITQQIADALRDSLWERQVRRLSAEWSTALREVVANRARFIWRSSTPTERRGWYLAGLGADAGQELGEVADAIVDAIGQAEVAINDEEFAAATSLLQHVATLVFSLSPFKPETSVSDWQDVLAHWVNGEPLGSLERTGPDDRIKIAQFIESDLGYRLVWGMEAARVYQDAQGGPHASSLTGSALTAIETGTFLRAASILIRSGFDYRLAAISAVQAADETFDSVASMWAWIEALEPEVANSKDWPTTESHDAWVRFASRTVRASHEQWQERVVRVDDITWLGAPPLSGSWLRVTTDSTGQTDLWSPGYDSLGVASVQLNPARKGSLYARRPTDGQGIDLFYWGPDDLYVTAPKR